MSEIDRQVAQRQTADSLLTVCRGTHGRLAWAIATAVALAVVVTACTKVESDPEAGDSSQPPVEVRAAIAEARAVRPSINWVGTVVAIPEQTAVVSPQGSGWITNVSVVDGQTIKAGDLLVEFDPRAARLALKRATAVVREKQATLERLKRGPLPEEIAEARQTALQATTIEAALRNELAALRELHDRKEVSEVVYGNKSKALEGAVAAAAAAAERVKLLEAGTRPELIEEARGLLEAAEADQARAQLELQWCTVTSPIDGMITQLVARRGQFFGAAQPVVTIVDLSSVFVQLRIPGVHSVDVKVGTPVTVRLAALPNQVFKGSVARVASQADSATGNVIAFARIRNDDGALRTGQNCQARILLPEVSDAVVIPVAAVADHGGQSVVTVIRRNRAFETPVETGVEADGLMQITKGLTVGDTVATSGGYGLPPGCPVKVVEDAATASSQDKSRK